MTQAEAHSILTGFADFLDLHQREVAEAIGINPVTLSKWRGSSEPVARTTAKLVNLLKCRPEAYHVLKDLHG